MGGEFAGDRRLKLRGCRTVPTSTTRKPRVVPCGQPASLPAPGTPRINHPSEPPRPTMAGKKQTLGRNIRFPPARWSHRVAAPLSDRDSTARRDLRRLSRHTLVRAGHMHARADGRGLAALLPCFRERPRCGRSVRRTLVPMVRRFRPKTMPDCRTLLTAVWGSSSMAGASGNEPE